MFWNIVSYEFHSSFIWIFIQKSAIKTHSFKFWNKKVVGAKFFIANGKVTFDVFLYWIISPWSSLVSDRQRRRNRAIENSSASARQRRWPRVESIWTTFSLARWPCNCPVASAGAPQSSLYRIPLLIYIYLSFTHSASIFLYRRLRVTRNFRMLSVR